MSDKMQFKTGERLWISKDGEDNGEHEQRAAYVYDHHGDSLALRLPENANYTNGGQYWHFVDDNGYQWLGLIKYAGFKFCIIDVTPLAPVTDAATDEWAVKESDLLSPDSAWTYLWDAAKEGRQSI